MKESIWLRYKRPVQFATAILLALLTYALLASIPPAPRITAAVFVLVVVMWLTEVVPLFVPAILGPVLLQVLLDPLAHSFGFDPISYKKFIFPFASPVVVLMLGGFFMARIFSKYHLDIEFSNWALSKLGTRPSVVLLGMMSITALLSMWMSNTATTALMVAAVLPIAKKMPEGSNFSRALMLAIPFAANIGGIGTPIGTPPNAIAIGLLSESGIQISFLSWMIVGIPPMILLLVVLWLLLLLFFPSSAKEFNLQTDRDTGATHHVLVYTTFGVTVLLWLTDALHGIPSAIIAMLPLLVFSLTGAASKKDIRDISWDILILIGGGIAMGTAISETGLGNIIVQAISVDGSNPILGVLIFGALVAGIGTFMSHTASANLVLPLAITFGIGNPVLFAVATALAASYGMALPVSTPPNAIAYASDMIRVKDMVKVGVIITIIGVLLTSFYSYWILNLLSLG